MDSGEDSGGITRRAGIRAGSPYLAVGRWLSPLIVLSPVGLLCSYGVRH
jgi:hypothetical protein